MAERKEAKGKMAIPSPIILKKKLKNFSPKTPPSPKIERRQKTEKKIKKNPQKIEFERVFRKKFLKEERKG